MLTFPPPRVQTGHMHGAAFRVLVWLLGPCMWSLNPKKAERGKKPAGGVGGGCTVRTG